MASKDLLLSLVVPTYNRERFLHEQLCWLLKESLPFRDKTEIIVLDNASTDATSRILEQFDREDAQRIDLRSNEKNVGLVRNCINGIYAAKGKFVWLVGDDDPLKEGLLAEIIGILELRREEIRLLHLNHRCTDGFKGPVIIESFYKLQKDACEVKGPKLMNELLRENHTGGLMFITANIMEKASAIEVVESTEKELVAELAFPMYLNAKLGLRGGLYYYSPVFVDCVYNQSSWLGDFNVVHHIQLPKFWFRLRKDGLDKNVITTLIRTARSKETEFRLIPFLSDIVKFGFGKTFETHKHRLARLRYEFYFWYWKLTFQR